MLVFCCGVVLLFRCIVALLVLLLGWCDAVVFCWLAIVC